MNEHDELEMIPPPVISARVTMMPHVAPHRLSGSSVNLPAALAMTSFLPYARESGSFEPQRRWLPIAFLSDRTIFKISGSVGHLDHPTCCLHISGPVRPRKCFHHLTHSTYERGRTIRNEAGR
jgi:hypothetical protein